VQITGTLLFDTALVIVMGAALWLGAAGTLMAGAGSLKRQALAVRL
jgi:hypothetical protein